MIFSEQFMDILSLHQEGHSMRAIARLTGLSRNTVRKVIRGEHQMKRSPPSEGTILQPCGSMTLKRKKCPRHTLVRSPLRWSSLGTGSSFRFIPILGGGFQDVSK